MAGSAVRSYYLKQGLPVKTAVRITCPQCKSFVGWAGDDLPVMCRNCLTRIEVDPSLLPRPDLKRAFPSTADCPTYPPALKRLKPQLAVGHMGDEEIDGMLEAMRKRGELGVEAIPKTQYGRRVAVDAMIKFEHWK